MKEEIIHPNINAVALGFALTGAPDKGIMGHMMSRSDGSSL
jgi:hypothetical protein